ncbi:wiskott-Aldrich syndrome protein family member 3 [Aethina tumida]|uniref:wiskott-Aldrich syndrome protein family member 3 n=1 Tax=Aethina tumida TaxID=116153 RepID=UPI00096ADBDE|nr:wiskott-Aldrich syndrome protein family member 3 [Aethina tumida]
MPLPKRVIEPVHVTRGTLPDDYPLPSELEGVTNGTLANTVRQLSSLSRHAEDLFGELARDAQQLYDRSNSLQARIDRLAIKVTQLDSTVEEVSLQDIHMRKAFKSSTVFDQHIFARATMPTAMLETYNSCDKPPPLDKLNGYRDDGKDGLKFYTDPNYFFELWRQEMLNDTERMMHDRGKKPHRPRADGGQGNRHKKRVRQPHNTRERQKQIAMGHGETIMNPNTIYRTPQQIQLQQTDEMMMEQQRPPRPNSIEIRRSYQQEMPDGMPSPAAYPPYEENPYQHGMYGQGPLSSESLNMAGGTPTRGKARPSQPPPAPPSNTSTPSANTPTRGRSMSTGRDNLPPPPPPPEASMSPPNGIPSHVVRQSSVHSRSSSPQHIIHPMAPEPPLPPSIIAPQDLPPPPPAPVKQASPPKQPPTPAAPPPPPPPPMPMNGGVIPPASPPAPLMNGNLANILTSTPPKLTPVKDRPIAKQGPPLADPRNDLLKAIRDGIKLRKVEKTERKEVEQGNGLHDVASILARRVAVELSDTDSGSESEDSEGWGENETSA